MAPFKLIQVFHSKAAVFIDAVLLKEGGDQRSGNGFSWQNRFFPGLYDEAVTGIMGRGFAGNETWKSQKASAILQNS